MKEKIWKNRHKILIGVLPLIYFIFSIRYYLIEYYVYDFSLYASWPTMNYMAKDGYSSLWIWICSFVSWMPRQMTLLCLCLLTLTLLHFSLLIYQLFEEKGFRFYLCLAILYSCSIWYYYYGKIFQDFPFTAYSYSICILILNKMFSLMKTPGGYGKDLKLWYIFCAMASFTLSWKLYNVFAVAGVGLLFLCKKETRQIFFSIIKSAKNVIISIFCVLAGYVVGNYNLLIDPINTLKGLSGFPASYDFSLFLWGKTRTIWDHVGDLPFNISVMFLGSVIIFLYILPLINKKVLYFLTSVFMTVCLYLFISFFSTGAAWHGFSTGLFILTYIIFLLSEIDIEKKINARMLLIAIVCQLASCFFYYIPKQTEWFNITNKAISELQENESFIYEDVLNLVKQTGEEKFTIDIAVKRYKPIPTASMLWKKVNLHNTYITPLNYVFVDPLEATDYFDWRDLKRYDNYTIDSQLCTYIIWIVPDSFKVLSDVAELNIYSNNAITNIIHGKGYSIYLVKR